MAYRPFGTKYVGMKRKGVGVHQVDSGKWIVRVKKANIVNGRGYGCCITTLKQFETENEAQEFYRKYLAENDPQQV